MNSFSKISLFLFTAGVLAVSCTSKEPAKQTQSIETTPTTQVSNPSYAIVDIDSLMINYKFCQEREKELESKQNTYSNQFNSKVNAFQNHAAKFQEDLQNSKFTSQQEAENAQAKLQNEQASIQQMQAKIEGDMAKAMQSYQSVLQDSIHNFIKDFNKDGKYKAIFSKSGNNVLFVDPSIDVTKEVIEGLNKRYKSKK